MPNCVLRVRVPSVQICAVAQWVEQQSYDRDFNFRTNKSEKQIYITMIPSKPYRKQKLTPFIIDFPRSSQKNRVVRVVR